MVSTRNYKLQHFKSDIASTCKCKQSYYESKCTKDRKYSLKLKYFYAHAFAFILLELNQELSESRPQIQRMPTPKTDRPAPTHPLRVGFSPFMSIPNGKVYNGVTEHNDTDSARGIWKSE